MKPKSNRSRSPKRSYRRVKSLAPVESVAVHGKIPSIPSAFVGLTPEKPWWEYRRDVAGVALPEDVWKVVEKLADEMLKEVRRRLTTEPWTFCPEEWTQAERDAWRPMDHDHDWQNLGMFLGMAIQRGFFLALIRYGEHLKCVGEARKLVADIAENGELAAAGMRDKKAMLYKARASEVCQLWENVRRSFRDDRYGNRPALEAVAERYQLKTGRRFTTRAIREILKKHGYRLPK